MEWLLWEEKQWERTSRQVISVRPQVAGRLTSDTGKRAGDTEAQWGPEDQSQACGQDSKAKCQAAAECEGALGTRGQGELVVRSQECN